MFVLVCTHVSAHVHTWTFGRARTHKDLRARKLHVSPRVFMPVRIHTCVHTHARASEHIRVPTHVFATIALTEAADLRERLGHVCMCVDLCLYQHIHVCPQADIAVCTIIACRSYIA